MDRPSEWWEGLAAAVTVTDHEGRIVAMNARARETFAAEGGGDLVGRSVFDCHPARARARLQQLFDQHAENHYTVTTRGRRKIIHQLPWHRDGVFAGVVEISVPIPEDLPHFDRDAPRRETGDGGERIP